jgi:hypothetical protein
MNTFYNIVELMRARLEANPLVNTIIFARTDEKDLYKKSLYPIVHIIPAISPYKNSQVSQFTFEVGAFEQRDIVQQPSTTKFEGNDNIIDNLNITYVIINDLLTYLQTQNNDYNIELVGVNKLIPIQYNDFNILDGWSVNFTLQAPNGGGGGSGMIDC